MTEENTSGLLSAEESAYFESGGETAIVEAPLAEAVAGNETETVAEPGAEIPTAERDEKGRFVPHQALHAEREEHKKTRSELQEIRQKQAILEDRWNTLLSATKQPDKVEEQAPPDPLEDIFAYSKWQKEQFDKLQAKITEREQAEQQTRQQQEQESAVWGHWNQSVQQFAAQTPDFNDAAQYLASLRTKQLEAIGLDVPSINRTINEELKGVIIQGAQTQKSPAELIYNYAKASGYTQAAPADKNNPAKLELPSNLARVQAAQEASKTIGNASGGPDGDVMTAEALLAMPAKDFDKWATENASAFKKLMGG